MISAIYKTYIQDFFVSELMSPSNTFDELGGGEHLWIWVEKIGVNTTYLVKLLAECTRIPLYDVGYSGLKDRNAVTYQWFSLRLPKLSDVTQIQSCIQKKLKSDEGVKILDAHWCRKKLNRGTHIGNHFVILLREVIGDQTYLNEKIERVKMTGVPNYFGEQRFGIDGDNVAKAKSYFEKILKAKYGKRKLSQQESLWVSVARSYLFNQILYQRVVENTWNQAVAGDVFNLNGTNSIFASSIDDDIRNRMLLGDIHPTAPLYGIQGKIGASKDVLAIEQGVLEDDENMVFVQGLLKLGIRSDRRALRVMVSEWVSEWQDESTLKLSFSLPAGAFATSVLSYLIDDLKNADTLV